MKYKYTGKGAIPGIPARDLNESEMKIYAEPLYYSTQEILDSGVFVVQNEKADNPPAKKDGK